MAKRDYYEVLGITRTASAAEIKKAFRRAAMDHHPDRNPGSKRSEDKFKEAAEAYAVLGDVENRARYDRAGHAQESGGGTGGGFDFGGFDFGGFRGFEGFGEGTRDAEEIFGRVEDLLDRFATMFGGGKPRPAPGRGAPRASARPAPGTWEQERDGNIPRVTVSLRENSLEIHVDDPTKLTDRQRDLIFDLAGEFGESMEPEGRRIFGRRRKKTT